MTKLEELKAAYEAATPGEWNNTEQSNGLNSVYGNCQFDSMADADLIAFDLRNGDDAEFIALAHSLMPQLLEAVEALKAVKGALAGNPQVHVGNTTVHYAYHKANSVLEELLK